MGRWKKDKKNHKAKAEANRHGAYVLFEPPKREWEGERWLVYDQKTGRHFLTYLPKKGVWFFGEHKGQGRMVDGIKYARERMRP